MAFLGWYELVWSNLCKIPFLSLTFTNEFISSHTNSYILTKCYNICTRATDSVIIICKKQSAFGPPVAWRAKNSHTIHRTPVKSEFKNSFCKRSLNCDWIILMNVSTLRCNRTNPNLASKRNHVKPLWFSRAFFFVSVLKPSRISFNNSCSKEKSWQLSWQFSLQRVLFTV